MVAHDFARYSGFQSTAHNVMYTVMTKSLRFVPYNVHKDVYGNISEYT